MMLSPKLSDKEIIAILKDILKEKGAILNEKKIKSTN